MLSRQHVLSARAVAGRSTKHDVAREANTRFFFVLCAVDAVRDVAQTKACARVSCELSRHEASNGVVGGLALASTTQAQSPFRLRLSHKHDNDK